MLILKIYPYEHTDIRMALIYLLFIYFMLTQRKMAGMASDTVRVLVITSSQTDDK